jgi:hypothetical protein
MLKRALIAFSLVLLACLCLFVLPACAGQFQVGSYTYWVDGKPNQMDAAPFIENGRTYVPIRYLALALGVAEKEIGWDAKSRTVMLKLGDTTVKLTVGKKTISVNGQARKMDVAPVIKGGRTYLPARWVAEAFGYETKWETDLQSVKIEPLYKFASKYIPGEIVRDPVTAGKFIGEYLNWESLYFEIAREKNGTTADGWYLNPKTLLPEAPRDWSAPSKEAFDIAILVKAIVGDKYAVRLIGKGDPGVAKKRAIGILKAKLRAYKQFHRDYPYYAGFLPWIKVKEDTIEPKEDWRDRFPSLDNGMWVWTLYAAYHALEDAGESELASEYKEYFDMLVKAAPYIIYDFELHKIRAEVKVRNIKSRFFEPANYQNNTPGYFLNDPYEGIMMAFFLTLFCELPQEEEMLIWRDIQLEKVETELGTICRPWPSHTIDGSTHIKFPYLFLPILDNPVARKVFLIQEKIRTNINKYGFPSSISTPGATSYTSYDTSILAPYGAFPLILAATVTGDVTQGNYGLAWLANMLRADKMQGPCGSGESFSVTETGKLHKVSFVLTADGKMPIWLALMGGIIEETREALKKDGLYDPFIEIVRQEYQEAFGDGSSVRDVAQFCLPEKITGKYKVPTDLREIWGYPEIDNWGDKVSPETVSGKLVIRYTGDKKGWGWAGGRLKEPFVPERDSAIYFKGNGSFQLKLENLKGEYIFISVSMQGEQQWTKVPLGPAAGNTITVMVFDCIWNDVIVSGIKLAVTDGFSP